MPNHPSRNSSPGDRVIFNWFYRVIKSLLKVFYSVILVWKWRIYLVGMILPLLWKTGRGTPLNWGDSCLLVCHFGCLIKVFIILIHLSSVDLINSFWCINITYFTIALLLKIWYIQSSFFYLFCLFKQSSIAKNLTPIGYWYIVWLIVL